MALEDKTLECRDCGTEFAFTSGEQEFYQEKGLLHEPSRCPSCRSARRQTGGYGSSQPRTMYPVVCDECGKETEVPFQPTQGKPVYCRECFQLHKNSSGF